MRTRLLIVSFLALALAGACRSESGGGPPPKVAEAHAERDVVDGAAKLSTTVTVRFDRPFTLAESKVPLSSLFELEVPDPGRGAGATRRVFVSKAEAKPETRVIALAVDSLVPDGAKLKVANKAFQAGAEGEMVAEVTSDLTLTSLVLATTALMPATPGLFDEPVAPDVKAEDRDPQAQRAALQAHMEKRGADTATTQNALTRYDTMPAAAIPSAKVRAALAALTGTFAEPAIDALLTGQNCTGKPIAQIVIQPPPDFPKLLARVTFTADKQRVLSLNPVLEGDRIEHLMPLLAHEAIHCDTRDTRTEEVVATAFDTFLYLQLVAADPGIVAVRSPAGRELNADAIAMINSGRRFPESVGLLPSAGITRALPNTNATFGSFAELVAAAYPSVDSGQPTPEAVADAYVAKLALAANMQPQSAFNVTYIDELLGRALDQRALAADIAALGLEPA
jgi:hypothetical protein